MPMIRPLVVWVTRQAELVRQALSASRSKETVRYGWPDCVDGNRSTERGGGDATSGSR